MTLLLEVLQKSVANLVSSQMIVLTLCLFLGESGFWKLVRDWQFLDLTPSGHLGAAYRQSLG
jgi:hypothetical protein